MTAATPSRRPPLWLIGAVALAHAALLPAPPARPAPQGRPAPALLTRAVATSATSPTAPAIAPPQPALPSVSAAPVTRPATTPARRATPPAPARPQAPPRPARAPRSAGAVVGAETDAGAHAAAAPAAAPSPRAAEPAAAPPHAPVRVPGAATLRYQVTGQARGLPYEASAELHWRRAGQRYEAEWSVDLPLLGTRTQRSEGRVTASGLAPERFAERARGERAAHFDFEGGRIRFSANTPDAVLAPGAQDRLSVTLQLTALLAAAPERYPPGTQITLQTAGVRDAEPWVWEVQADETLPLAGRALATVRLLRAARHEYDTRVELWLAPALGHLPVRLRLTQANGDVADQQLQSLDDTPPPR